MIFTLQYFWKWQYLLKNHSTVLPEAVHRKDNVNKTTINTYSFENCVLRSLQEPENSSGSKVFTLHVAPVQSLGPHLGHWASPRLPDEQSQAQSLNSAGVSLSTNNFLLYSSPDTLCRMIVQQPFHLIYKVILEHIYTINLHITYPSPGPCTE